MQAGCIRDTLAWTRTGIAEVGVKGKSTRSFVLRTHVFGGMRAKKSHIDWWIKAVPASTGAVPTHM